MPTYNPRPRINLQGIDDRSAAVIPLEAEQLPQHLPAMFLLTERSEEVAIASGAYLTTKYGAETLNPTSNYFNHQTAMATHILSEGNQVMVVPIKMPDSKRATIRLSAEVVPITTVSDSGAKSNKNRIIWHAEEVAEGSFAQADIEPAYRDGTTESALTGQKLGVLLDSNDVEHSVPSIRLPILDMQAPARGELGSRLGFVLDTPFITDPQPTDQTLANRLNSFVYRLMLVERQKNSVTHSVTYNQYAATSSDFVLRPNAVDNRTGLEVSLGDVIVNNYSTESTSRSNSVLSPFNQPAIYQDNIETLAYMLAAGHEIQAVDENGTSKVFTIPGLYDSEEEALTHMYRTNILTGRDYNGDAYPNMHMDGAYLFDGVEFGRDSVIYARGGDDGFPVNNAGVIDKLETLRIYDEEVRRWCNEFDDTKPIFDSAVYPFSTLWDSGFSVPTKLSLLVPMARHKRIWSVLATQSCADYADADNTSFMWMLPNTGEQEIGIATRLNTAAHLYPESELFGTPVCRAVIVGRCGELRSGLYRGYLPLTHSLASKVAAYCGAGNGFWNRVKAMDSEENRIDKLFKNISITYQPNTAYDKSWQAGMNWVQNFDRDSVFFPAYQTVFKDSTSILDSLLTIIAASYVQRVGEIVWRKLVGNNLLGNAKFLEKSDSEIIKLTKNKFDGRFDIVPVTEYTSTDELLGYSWTTRVGMYGDVPNLLNDFRIETYRRPTV